MAKCHLLLPQNFLVLVIDDGSTDETPQRAGKTGLARAKKFIVMPIGVTAKVVWLGTSSPPIWAQRTFFKLIRMVSATRARFRGCGRGGRRHQRSMEDAGNVMMGRPDASSGSVLRCLLKLSWHTQLNDTNVPYRLYQTDAAGKKPRQKSRATLTWRTLWLGLADGAIGIRSEEPIHFRDRLGGHPSVRWWGFARKGPTPHKRSTGGCVMTNHYQYVIVGAGLAGMSDGRED